MSEQLTFNEAPTSVTIKTYSPTGYDILLTIRDADTAALMGRMKSALSWLAQNGYLPTPNGRTPNANGAPMCSTHNTAMKPSQHGGYFCPVKIADDDGTGKSVYCKQQVK